MRHKLQTNEERLYQYLVKKYNKMVLSKLELAIELGVSKSTIDHAVVRNEAVPPFKKMGSSKNARVVFNIADVAKFLDETVQTNII